jgi:SAM-dependent methyltransferase
MQKLPFENNSFDLIVHSDTLEHVENSKQALLENFRVLKENGSLIYTIPVIYGRLTLDRHGLSNSYHGSQDENQGEDYKVWKEYGSDFWLELVEVGFSEIKITTINGLNSFAVIATKRTNINYSKSHYFYKIYSFLVLIKNIIQK